LEERRWSASPVREDAYDLSSPVFVHMAFAA
jgi:hypothetical protein